jgi:amidase
VTPDIAAPSDRAVFVQRFELGGNGPRVGIKDSIDVAGYPTWAGSAALADAPPAGRHAAVVAALLEAGCRIVGKTNLHELAFGVTGINHWTGTPVNPRMPDRIPGGSSSGSAVAVAARLVDFAIGTDTGGSIRIPAACCGVYGIKPSFGRISRAGLTPAVSTLDCVGPFAADLELLERALQWIDPSYRFCATPGSVTLGWVGVAADPLVTAALGRALMHPKIALAARSLLLLGRAYDAALTVLRAEYWNSFGHLVGSGRLGADVLARLKASRGVSAEELRSAEEVRRVFRDEIDAALVGVDALVLPTLPALPPTLESGRDSLTALSLSAFVRQFNFSGHPALSLPVETAAGHPTGMQLIGRRGGDEALCAVARVIVKPAG